LCYDALMCNMLSRVDLPSFPTRRSSDLERPDAQKAWSPSTATSFISSKLSTRSATRRRQIVSFRALPLGSMAPSKRCGWRSRTRSEEHTSELQSREKLVCRLLLEIKKKP